MTQNRQIELIRNFFLGKRYYQLTGINDQVRYMTLNAIFMLVILPLLFFGINMLGDDFFRGMTSVAIAAIALISLFLIRSKIPLNHIPPFPVGAFGLYCLYMVYLSDFHLWAAVAILSFPLIAIFLCRAKIGIIQSLLVLAGAIFLLFAPFAPNPQSMDIRVRFIVGYVLVLTLTIVYERISILKDRKEAALNAKLAKERDVIQAMKDNIHQGIFLMDTELRILPQYSKPMITILSYYESELEGKNLLDILASSLDAKQLQTMKKYFAMIFSKSKIAEVLEEANPISEFEYKVDGRIKTLSTRFHLIEEQDSEPAIVGVIQDITREKEFETELQAQREAQELEMKNMFDVIRIDPLVFQDFIEDTESNFSYINSILKDRSLTEKQVVTKFFQNVHAIKSNALVLGLETFGKKLHALEDDIKAALDNDKVNEDNVLSLAVKLEKIMQEKDAYAKIVNKIDSYKSSNQIDAVLIYSLTKAVENIGAEMQKKVELKVGHLDKEILESKLRKPIKDILFQCVRNSIYHGIEPADERVKKGKKPHGLITVSIKKAEGLAEIIFSDDGQGLDWEKIKTKYLKNYPEAKDTSKKVLLSSIFSPEFSTSGDITSLAGRGVGLSMVKDLVKNIGGTIKADSSQSGLIFKFLLPMPK